MKNYKILLSLLLLLAPVGASAQSSMTDTQVMQFIVKEHGRGTSNSQIVTKLIQSGVDITQIRRVRKRYEQQIQSKGFGMMADEAQSKVESRMRSNNGQKTTGQGTEMPEQNYSNYRVSEGRTATRTDYDDDNRQTIDNGVSRLTTDSIKKVETPHNSNKVFGRDIFNNKNLTFEPNMNIATPQNYRLGPGDAVIIDIYGASQKTMQATVSPEGDVTIEGYGPVNVSGLTVAQANARLRSTVGSRYSSSRVRLTVGQTRTIMVNVMGEVKAPGTYTLSAFATVFHALYMAGGTNDLGTLRNIKVYRQNRLITVVDIYDYILNGKLHGNVRLADNDVIVVGPYDCLVKVTGKVKRPMIYEMKRNESVGTLLKYAGGFTGDAYTKAVRLNRKTGRELSVYNVEEFDMSSFTIADGDSVSVEGILQRYANTVELKGAVFRPGYYQLGDGITSVRSLIEHADGLTEKAFGDHAVMHRMKADRSLEVISVDVNGILAGRVADIPLKENDVLFIPTKTDLQTERTITIHGEVLYPGVYQYADNETLEDFVLQAGGLTDKASTVKVDVARRLRNPKALTRDSLTAQVFTFALKDGFVIDGEQGFVLQPFDEVYVRQSPGFSAQKNITVEGQVMFAGTYTILNKNERLSDAIKAAGGVTDQAYVKGARLERVITADERVRMNTILHLIASRSGEKDSLNAKAFDFGNIYYVGIDLEEALKHPGCDGDVVLREGDRIVVPEYNGTVKISGEVMYPNSVAYERGKKATYYIDEAGGFRVNAKKSQTFIVYMNGKVGKVSHGARVMPGCEIVVPSKGKHSGLALGQWLSISTSVASIATMIATIANLSK